MIWLYNLFLTVGSLVWVPWTIWRARKRKEPVDWKERSGDYKFQLKKGEARLWIHAVSVGEVVAALPILREVRRIDPGLEIVLSVTTSSGHKTAEDRAQGLFDHLVYYPIDVYRFVLAALVRVRPTAVAVMETELWMNFLDAAHNLGAKTMLVNGRISDRSFPRAMKLRFFYRDLLKRIDRCLMQSQLDADRIAALGGKGVDVLGNTKFDEASIGALADPDAWRKKLGIEAGRQVVVVGSTRSELEERLVMDAFAGTDAYIVWAPRHLERAKALGELAAAHRPVTLRSSQEQDPPVLGYPSILILDSYGELSDVYSVADIVVIGGGFDNLGGQNLIQPLAHGKPVIHGPHMQNFRDIADSAQRCGASVIARDSVELSGAVQYLLENPQERERRGSAAKLLVQQNIGASAAYAQAIVAAARS